MMEIYQARQLEKGWLSFFVIFDFGFEDFTFRGGSGGMETPKLARRP